MGSRLCVAFSILLMVTLAVGCSSEQSGGTKTLGSRYGFPYHRHCRECWRQSVYATRSGAEGVTSYILEPQPSLARVLAEAD